MLRVFIVVIWLGLILGTALTLQVFVNWLLSLAFILYLFTRWRARRRRVGLQKSAGSSNASLRGSLSRQPLLTNGSLAVTRPRGTNDGAPTLGRRWR